MIPSTGHTNVDTFFIILYPIAISKALLQNAGLTKMARGTSGGLTPSATHTEPKLNSCRFYTSGAFPVSNNSTSASPPTHPHASFSIGDYLGIHIYCFGIHFLHFMLDVRVEMYEFLLRSTRLIKRVR